MSDPVSRTRVPEPLPDSPPILASDPLLVSLPASTPPIQGHGLGHRFGRLRVLDGVDVALAAGERVALRGANGSGKTTLLRILVGLLRPQRGAVERGEGGQRLAFVGQAPQVYPELTAFENVLLFARLQGLEDPVASASAALAAFGLDDRPRLRARQLSRGQQQRLALARAFMAAPDIIALDEPWTALDEAGAALLDAAVRAASQRGAAVLFAVHDGARAALTDRTLTIAAGRLTIDVWPGAAVERGAEPEGKPAVSAETESAEFDRAAPGILRGAWLIAHKDIVTELRAREILPAMGVFAALCGVVLAYALGGAGAVGAAAGGGMADMARVAPGAFWVALLFGGTLGLGRMMAAEVDTDALSALRLTPLDGGALFLGKWAAATMFTLGIAVVLAPLWVALFALRPGDALGLIAIALAGVPGWAAAGVLVAALSATARGREVLLPILLFPLLLPLVLAAVRATGSLLADAPSTSIGPALAMLLAYDVIFCVVGFWLFPVVVETT